MLLIISVPEYSYGLLFLITSVFNVLYGLDFLILDYVVMFYLFLISSGFFFFKMYLYHTASLRSWSLGSHLGACSCQASETTTTLLRHDIVFVELGPYTVTNTM